MSTVINTTYSPMVNVVDCRPHGDCEININDNLADDSRKIFVGGLSWETSEEDLRKYFSEFGMVKSCIIKLDRYTNHSRGFGFVIFDSEDAVNKVLDIKEHVLNKKRIDPKKAKPSREPQKKVFVGGLDPDLSESMIKDHFSQFGEIENIETPFDTRKNKRKAYLFITFSNESEARKAASQECQELSGKKFEVRIAIPREQANRTKGWKTPGNNMFYQYAMLPYMYPEYFYSYLYNNPGVYNSFYNPYELLNYDPISLSRQFSTGVMINNNNSNNPSTNNNRPKLLPNNNNAISTKSNPFIDNSHSTSSSATPAVTSPAVAAVAAASLPNGNVFVSHNSSSSSSSSAAAPPAPPAQRTNQNFNSKSTTNTNNNDSSSINTTTATTTNLFEQ